FNGKSLRPGNFSVKATAYTQADGAGKAIATSTTKFTFTEPKAFTTKSIAAIARQGANVLTDLGMASGLDLAKSTVQARDNTPANSSKRHVIVGDAGDNILIGVDPDSQLPGKGERDTLLGKQGADTFVLGDADGIFYDDGNVRSLGRQDFARIKDFSGTQGDVIQLHGQESDYTLGAVSSKNQQISVGIFANPSDRKELIGIVENGGNLALESTAFQFV
ncbi:MAG: calcium-binding protein, partial [Phormidesmis sp.]